MDSECSLIVTLPSFSNIRKISQMFRDPRVSGARLNTGAFNPHSAMETVSTLKELAEGCGKKLWIDLKCRQLRVTRWAAPEYQCIEVNHSFTVELPATLCLRGEKPLDIVEVSGNRITVDPLPLHAVGAGQSVNVLGQGLRIDGYLTENDEKYLEACAACGVNGVMISFAQGPEDVAAVRSYLPNAEAVCKIESLRGVEAASSLAVMGCTLMAARDDLYIENGRSPSTLGIVRRLAEIDPGAICASRIFSSLEKQDSAELCDYSDLHLMYSYGYRRFMLSDGISINCFDKACRAWDAFTDTL